MSEIDGKAISGLVGGAILLALGLAIDHPALIWIGVGAGIGSVLRLLYKRYASNRE